MKKLDFDFFNKLRVDTVHVKPFNTPARITTSFPGGLTISAGKTVDIPLGKVDERGNLVIDSKSPITVDGKPDDTLRRSTTRTYFFTDKPNEDAIALSQKYYQILQELVIECHEKFRPS